jgi:uncharacterized OB-fold protein
LADTIEKKKVALKRGVYTIPTQPGEEPKLLGSQCKKCETKYYPQRPICPVCASYEMEEISLSKRGKIWAYSIARQTYPGTMLPTPFFVAYVELPEKVYVMTQITGVTDKDIKVGMDVEFYEYKLTEDGDREVIVFAFRPVSGSPLF